MRKIRSIFLCAAVVMVSTACTDAPKKRGPVHPTADKKISGADNNPENPYSTPPSRNRTTPEASQDSREVPEGNPSENPGGSSSEVPGKTNPSVTPEGRTKDIGSAPKTEPSTPEDTSPPTTPSAPQTADSGNESSTNAPSTPAETLVTTLTSKQNTFLVSLDAKVPNCYLEARTAVTFEKSSFQTYTLNPAQKTLTTTKTAGTCKTGSWNIFPTHFE